VTCQIGELASLVLIPDVARCSYFASESMVSGGQTDQRSNVTRK
jgi:hypothetical protein